MKNFKTKLTRLMVALVATTCMLSFGTLNKVVPESANTVVTATATTANAITAKSDLVKSNSNVLKIALPPAPVITNDTFGFWGYQNISTPNFNAYNAYGTDLRGVHIILPWSLVKPTYAGAYDWSALNKMLDSAIARDIFITFQTQVGQNSPTWVLDSAGSFTTHGHPQVGPYPKYYSPQYKKFFYQFLKDVGNYLSTLSPSRRARIIAWHIAEGSTGDEQPYKGILDAPYVGDPYVPQQNGANSFNEDWYDFRRAAWDTAALSPGYTAVNTQIALMLNAGNDGQELGYIVGQDSLLVEDNQIGYIESHFSYLPIKPWIKEGFLSHTYGFRGELSYFHRKTTPSRGEVQQFKSIHFHKDLFVLECGALDAGLAMLNYDNSAINTYHETYETILDPRLASWFTRMTNTTNEGFSMPAYKVDYADTLQYPTSTFGALIDPARYNQYQVRLYNYSLQVAATGGNYDYQQWLYWRAVDAYVNPARMAAIDALYPFAKTNADTGYQNDHTINAVYNYEKNLYQLNVKSTMQPVYRVGEDTSLYGRYAGKPLLDASNKCTWYYDVNDAISNTKNDDLVEVTITYLDNNSGGSFSVSCIRCGKQRVSPVTTVSTNTGKWKTVVVDIPKFKFRPNGYDFMIDFTGSVTIGFVQVWNKSKG